MKKRITIGTLTLLSLMGMFGCKQQETVEALMTLDVKADYPEKEWVVQDFLDVEYIPLETNDEFITQGSVKAIGKRFVLVTNLLNDGNIFVFDRKTGKAVRKINRKGQGAEEYAFINGIILDEEKDEMFVNSASNKKIFVYDLQGNFKRSFQHAEGAQYLDVFDYDADNLICYDMSASYKDGQKRIRSFTMHSYRSRTEVSPGQFRFLLTLSRLRLFKRGIWLLSLPFALSRLTRETGCLPIPLPIRCIAIFPEKTN